MASHLLFFYTYKKNIIHRDVYFAIYNYFFDLSLSFRYRENKKNLSLSRDILCNIYEYIFWEYTIKITT